MCTVIASSDSAGWTSFCNEDGLVGGLGKEEDVRRVKWRYDHGGSRIVKEESTVGLDGLRLREEVLVVVVVFAVGRRSESCIS